MSIQNQTILSKNILLILLTIHTLGVGLDPTPIICAATPLPVLATSSKNINESRLLQYYTGWGDNFGWLINSVFYNLIELSAFLM
jgi:hypothetical protein